MQGREEDHCGDEDLSRTIFSRIRITAERSRETCGPRRCSKGYSPSIQMTSFAEHSNVILKFFAPKEQRFPKRPHTLRDLFVEINLP